MKLLTNITSTPKNITELKENIDSFFDNIYEDKSNQIYNPISPRYFRIALGVSKQTLSYWKTSPNKDKQEMFDLIKTYEDLLLGNIEQATLTLALTNKDDRVNIIGLLNTMRAYDPHRYIPESRPITTDNEAKQPIIISMANESKLKLDHMIKEK